MKQTKKGLIVLAAILALSAGILIRGVSPLQAPATGTWAPLPGPMAMARSSAASSLLADGRVLITGGSNSGVALSSAEFMNADGSFTAAPSMTFARAGHTSTVMPDGRVLVAGGTDASGRTSDTAEIFDPTANAWTSSPSLMVARSGHTATVLADGRILIAGGVSSGAPTASLEIYDSVSGSFTSAASSLNTPRQNHAAALLSDGRVLIVGGSDGTQSLASSEIFDPANGSVSAGPVMGLARSGLSATTLLDGSVLVAGGSIIAADGSSNDVASAEILDAATTSFTATSSMAAPRSGHLAFLLPHNNNVLMFGGTSNGAAIASSEMYTPWLGTFSATGAMSSARTSASGSTLATDGILVVAGGSDGANSLSAAEAYGFATIKTDAADYPPGTVVNISGSGWQPNETVQLNLVEVPDVDADSPILISTTADANGNISDSSFVTDAHDLNVAFSLTAVGSVSQAQTRFTDSAPINTSTSLNAISTPLTTGQTGVPFSGVVSLVTSTDPAIPAGSEVQLQWFTHSTCSGSPIATVSTTINSSGNYNGTFTAPTVVAATTFGYQAQYQGADNGLSGPSKITWKISTSPCQAITVNATVPTTTVVASSGNPSTYGQSVTFTATVSPNSGSNAPTGSIQFVVDGTNLGSPVTLTASGSNGVAISPAISTLSVTGSPHSVVATYTPSGIFTGTGGSLSGGQAVNAKTLTASIINNPTKPYDGNTNATLTSANFSLSGLVGSDSFTVTQTAGTYNSANVATASTVTASLATGNFTANGTTLATNYNLPTTASGPGTITAIAATWTTNPNSKTYGDADPSPMTTGSGSGFLAADGVAATYTRAAGETVTGGPYHITATLAPAGVLGNYNITNSGANFTINTKAATWTTNANSKTYGDADPVPLTTGSGSGFLAADGVAATYTRAAGETVTGGPYHMTATLTPAAVLTNYNITNAGADFTISTRPATWTTNANSKTYGDPDPNPLTTGSGTFLAADGVTATYSRAAGETVLGGPYHIAAALAPAGVLSNYSITNTGATFTISTRPATWTTNANSKTYGDPDPNPLTTGSGTFLAADGVTATYSRAAGETVLGGPYHIAAALAPAGVLSNYSITNTGADFTINTRLATWTTNPNSKTYGDLDPNPLTTGSGTFLAADGVTATYSRAAGETVLGGPYHITAALAPAGVLSNYSITNTGATFTISTRPATWTTNANSKTYGDPDPNPLTTGSGTFLAADGVTATYSRAAGETVLGGPYHIAAALAPAGVLSNYSITNTGADFTINTRLATWTTNPNSKTYGDLDPNPLTTGSGTFLAADGVTATYSRAAGETVLGGPYHITAALAPAGVLSNYNITNAGADFTISTRPATWTTNANSKTYGGPDPNPLTTGSGTNFVAADGVTGTYSRVAGETVLGGPYHIAAALAPAGVLSNYSITNTGADFTITPAATMITTFNSSPNPSAYDATVTFSATVGSTIPVNEGTVAFADTNHGDAAVCPALVGLGMAACGNSTLTIGIHNITAMYHDPAGNFADSASAAALGQAVVKRHTSVTITSTEIANFSTGSVAIGTTLHLQITVTDDDPQGTPITPTGTFLIGDPIASDIFSPNDGSGNGLCTLVGSGASASCPLTVVPAEADLHELTAGFPGDSVHLGSTQNADITVTAPLVSQKVCLSAPFNGQAIAPGSTVWFNAVFQTTGQKISTLTHLTFYHQSIQIGSNGALMPVPDGVITFDPSALSASTTFDAVNNRWVTILPTFNLAGKNWLSGMPVQLPSGLPAGTSPVTWCGQFDSDDASLNLGWQWAAAVYTKFAAFDSGNPSLYDLNSIGVKAVDDNKADVHYKNSDHAGTPENYLPFVTGGARGGGGGNYTGGYSGSGNLH